LGSIPMAVAAALQSTTLAPGDVVALNDPFAGGTHLPDVTLVMPVVSGQWSVVSGKRKLTTDHRSLTTLFYVANRAHHADIGGASPGSMGLATDIYGEGLRIPPVKIVRGGRVVEDMLQLLLANVRGADERRADFE